MIRESVQLSFDPATSSPEIQEVFADELSRTLWLGIRQGHMVEQHFNKTILKYAAIISAAKDKGELDGTQLFRILSSFAKPPTHCVIGLGEQEFAEELLPFVMGEKSITFEINIP